MKFTVHWESSRSPGSGRHRIEENFPRQSTIAAGGACVTCFALSFRGHGRCLRGIWQISGGKMDFVNGYLDAAVRFVGELVLALLPRWD